MDQFEKEVVVKEEDTDTLEHVNNVVYLQWVQDIAREHWEKQAPESVKEKYVWVVVRHELDYKKSCYLGDRLLVRTRVADDLNGATWGRHVSIYREEKLAMEAYSRWCLIDAKSGRPARITSEIENVFYGK